MTNHMNAAEQTAVFAEHVESLLWGDDSEWTDAAMAIVHTATNHVTGYALAMSLSAAIMKTALLIQSHGQTPVTTHTIDSDRDEKRRALMAMRFMQAATRPDAETNDEAYELFCRIEKQTEHDQQALSALYFHLVHIIHQMGQQLKQAVIDREATK